MTGQWQGQASGQYQGKWSVRYQSHVSRQYQGQVRGSGQYQGIYQGPIIIMQIRESVYDLNFKMVRGMGPRSVLKFSSEAQVRSELYPPAI